MKSAVLSLENFTKLVFLSFSHAVYSAFRWTNSKINVTLLKNCNILLFKFIFALEIGDVLLAVFSFLKLTLPTSHENCLCQYTSMY